MCPYHGTCSEVDERCLTVVHCQTLITVPAGGNAAANAMHQECRAQDVNCCIVGVPKSIDNDILLIDQCFGFETAVAEAQNALLAAKVEARSAYRYVTHLHTYLLESLSGHNALLLHEIEESVW